MPFEAGQRVGPYEILGLVGAGGMGEVYRARDPRLAREVAVKVLRDGFSDDVGRRRRFESEARAVAALGHPNVVAIHDVGLDADSPFLVTELLVGETLRERLRRGPLARRAALDVARQIARGLAAAHAKGIVHRDLKPANVFILRDGQVKILDFGIARSQRADRSDGTLTSDTGAGTAGTVAYMAPEQVRGQPADPRTDIFGFGIVFHEMIRGQRPFAGNTDLEVGAAILDREPPDLEDPVLDVIARRCLAKDPAARFQSAGDLAAALDALAEAATAPRTAPRRRWLLLAAAALAVAAAAAAAGLLIGRTDRSRAAAVSAAPAAPVRWTQVTFRRGWVTCARFGRDRGTILYSASWNQGPRAIHSVVVGRPESRELAGGGIGLVAISPTGELAVLTGAGAAAPDHTIGVPGFWFADSGTLATMPPGGGAPREISTNALVADWLPDGSLAAARWRWSSRGLETVVEAPLGKPIYTTAANRIVSALRVSPAGDAIALVVNVGAADDAGEVIVIDRAGRVRARSATWQSLQGIAWSGREVWYTATNEVNRALRSLGSGTGDDRLLLEGTGSLTLEDVSGDGRALFLATHIQRGIRIGGDRGPEREIGWFDTASLIYLSRDGQRILEHEGAFARGMPIVYLRPTDGASAIRLNDGYARSLSPDGRWAVMVANQDAVFQLIPTGPGQARRVPAPPCPDRGDVDWFPDSASLVSGCWTGHLMSTWVQDIAGGTPRKLVDHFVPAHKPASPDGKRLVLQDADEAPYLFDVAGGTPHKIEELPPGTRALGWTGDGAGLHLFRRDHERGVIEVERLDLASGRRTLLHTIGSEADVGKVDVSADGRVYAYGHGYGIQQLYMVEGLPLAPAN